MNTLFQSAGLTAGDTLYPPLSLSVGETIGWQGATHADCTALFDMSTGLAPIPVGGAVWFGRDLAKIGDAEILACLRRTAVLSWDGGLLENLSVTENILLPYLHRNLGTVEDGCRALKALRTNSTPGMYLGESRLHRTPHELSSGERPLTAILRAALLQPEVIIVCEIMYSLDPAARHRLDQSLSWLRDTFPNAGWLVLQTGTALPESLKGPILSPQR